MLTAAGGAGKTMALVALAVSVVTGRPWLGHFDVEPTRGKVLLALAEEDHDEVHRRLWTVAEGLSLTPAEREEVARRLVVLPLCGRDVALLEVGGAGAREAPALRELRQRLAAEADEDGWALVALDPLARWAGLDSESDNALATRVVQAIESLAEVPGGPTVLVAHHSSKAARAAGSADSRGVTGLVDGLRWEGQLWEEKGEPRFRQTKSNYSRPMPEPIELVRGPGGLLRVVTGDEVKEREDRDREALAAGMTADVRRVVHALRAEVRMGSLDAIARRAGMNLGKGRAAVQVALARGLIRNEGTKRDPIYVAWTDGDPMPRTDVERTSGDVANVVDVVDVAANMAEIAHGTRPDVRPEDAAALRRILETRPEGVRRREVVPLLREALGHCSAPRADAALRALGAQVQEREEHGPWGVAKVLHLAPTPEDV